MRIKILKRGRSEEEKRRRHLFGDRGAKFQAKVPVFDTSGIIGTITTMVTKDLLLLEINEDDTTGRG